MGIRDKEKARQHIQSNVGAIVGKEKDPKESGLTQKAYYITKAQYRLLRLMSADRGVDMSCLIREMLDRYLSDYDTK